MTGEPLDAKLRRLERAVASGEPDSGYRLVEARLQAGLPRFVQPVHGPCCSFLGYMGMFDLWLCVREPFGPRPAEGPRVTARVNDAAHSDAGRFETAVAYADIALLDFGARLDDPDADLGVQKAAWFAVREALARARRLGLIPPPGTAGPG